MGSEEKEINRGAKMLIKKEKKKIVSVVEVEKVVCDYCGNDFEVQARDGVPTFPGGTMSLEFFFGSKFDGQKAVLDICDKCFEAHIQPHIKKDEPRTSP